MILKTLCLLPKASLWESLRGYELFKINNKYLINKDFVFVLNPKDSNEQAFLHKLQCFVELDPADHSVANTSMISEQPPSRK